MAGQVPAAVVAMPVLTRAPFDETALTVRELRTDPVGVVLRADDPPPSGGRLGRPTRRGSRTGVAPSRVVAVWSEAGTSLLIRSFIGIVTAAYRH